MNKFKALFIAASMCASVGASAASSYLFDNPENRVYFGARASIDITSAANGGGLYSNAPGFSVGAVYNIPMFMNLYFEPGLSLFYNTLSTSHWSSFATGEIDPATGDPVIVPYQIDGSIRNFGFRIPLLVGYHFDFTEDIKVNVFTGPQLNLSLVSRYHQNEVRVPGEEQPSSSTSLFGTNGFKHFDLQWKFGVGVSYQRYYMDLSGAWGMTKIMSVSPMTSRGVRRNIFAITLGYNF